MCHVISGESLRGKVERFHQTLKRFLAKHAPAQSLAGRTPLSAFNARVNAKPSEPTVTLSSARKLNVSAAV